MPAHEPEALRKKAKEHAASPSEYRALEPAPAVAERAADPGLRPNSKEAAQVMSHWAEPGHTPDRASPKPRGDQAAAPAAEADAKAGAGDLVLCQLPADATEADVAPLRGQVKAKITAWGLDFDPSSVYLGTVKAGAGEQKAVLLKWSPNWGSTPTAHEIPPSLAPIDARAAVTGVKQLKGWSQLAAGDQTLLENLLGGESNKLSAAARRSLGKKFKAVGEKTEAQQATALKGLITGKDALPGVVDEKMATPSVKYTLAGPTDKKDYQFHGQKADAKEWIARFEDGTQLRIVAPKALAAGLHNHTVQQTVDAASYLPKAARTVINTVILNSGTNPEDPSWAIEYNDPNFHSYMTAGADGIVTVYPDKTTNRLPDDNYLRGTMIHETGHTWSYKTWGSDETKGKWVDWKAAMAKDKVSVSGYATKAIAEDVAETIQVYSSTLGTPRFDEYKKIVPNRFGILEKEYRA
ncbi:MAG: hypothetical protein U1A78_31025 [Polyangia bacterium]